MISIIFYKSKKVNRMEKKKKTKQKMNEEEKVINMGVERNGREALPTVELWVLSFLLFVFCRWVCISPYVY